MSIRDCSVRNYGGTLTDDPPTVTSGSTWLSGCWCRANRFLPCPESLADMLLRVLQEFVGPTQGIPAAV
jgi:hypothetical protein